MTAGKLQTLQTLQLLQISIKNGIGRIMVGCSRCTYPTIHFFSSQDHGRLHDEDISKHSHEKLALTLKITVGGPPCTCPSIHLSPAERRSQDHGRLPAVHARNHLAADGLLRPQRRLPLFSRWCQKIDRRKSTAETRLMNGKQWNHADNRETPQTGQRWLCIFDKTHPEMAPKHLWR